MFYQTFWQKSSKKTKKFLIVKFYVENCRFYLFIIHISELRIVDKHESKYAGRGFQNLNLEGCWNEENLKILLHLYQR